MTEDAYTLQYNQVVVEEAERHADVSGRYPFHNSVWRETYLRSMNLASVDGMLLRSTFLSGGSLYLSHQEYRTSLSTKAADIERDCILTDAEIAHNSEGIRLFFELDYRTSKSPLPSMETALLHIRVIYRTVQDCFPQVANYLVMHVMTCTRKRKQMRSTGSIQLAWGGASRLPVYSHHDHQDEVGGPIGRHPSGQPVSTVEQHCRSRLLPGNERDAPSLLLLQVGAVSDLQRRTDRAIDIDDEKTPCRPGRRVDVSSPAL